MVIIKRDGTKQDFDKKKIEAAVLKAFFAVDGKIDDYAIDKAKNIASFIESVCETEDEELGVEAIQDLVERGLCATKRKDVAKEYILYRHERSIIRTRNSKLRQRVMEKLMATNVQNQNANVDEYSFGGRNGEAASEQNRDIALNDIISPKSRDNHLTNRIYIHDLDSYAIGMHNCLTIPFDKLLANGFNTRQTDIRPANSIGTAFQLLAVIFQCQSLCQFGGVSASHLDWTMVPYVRKSFYKHFKDGLEWVENDTYTEVKYEDLIPQNHIKNVEEDYWTHSSKKLTTSEGDCYYDNLPINIYEDYHEKAYKYAMDMTKRELKQAVEGMFHNLNSLQSRSGNQLPFTSINFGTCTLTEGRMVIEALLRGSLNGVGALHRTSIFPCSIFQVGEGINKRPGDPNYDLFKLALQSTAKRLYPNYANIDWSGNAGYDKNDPRTYFATMGCRTANGWDINGFGQLKDGRGNICPVTIILPTLAIEAVKHYENGAPCGDLEQDTINLFMQILTDAIEDAKDTLIERFDYICSQNAASARFMYENGLMEGYVPEEGIKSALKHGTLAIGMLGLAEALQLLVGCDHTEEKGMKIAKQICQLYKDKCAKYKEEYKLNFGVYYSPKSVGAA